MPKPRSIQTKFVLVLIVPMLVAGIGVAALFAHVTAARLEQSLARKKENFVQFYQQSLGYALWNFDRRNIRNIAQALTFDRDLVGARVIEANTGRAVAEAGVTDPSGAAATVTVETPLTVEVQGGPRRIGTVELIFDRARINRAIRRQVLRDTALIGLLVAGVALGLWQVQRRLVAQPLQHFLAAFRQTRADGVPHPVPRLADDEIGEVAESYNRMTERIAADEAALTEAKDEVDVANRQLIAEKEQTEQALAELQRANQRIQESLSYAKRMQRAALDPPDADAQGLAELAVWWEPRDEVGGDVYCFARRGPQTAVVLMDCTGHGVPGALIGFVALDAAEHSLATVDPWTPQAVLADLDRRVRAQLHRAGSDRHLDDGLEAAVAIADPPSDSLAFAGVGIHLLALAADGAATHRGRRGGLGYRGLAPPADLASVTVPAASRQRFVLASDGVLEQPGGSRGLQLGRKRFARLGETAFAAAADAGEALARLRTDFAGWQGDRGRRDDCTVLAFRPHPPA